mmetsp:Transcript_58888/g.137596  ORF Transcript_58888/g.137596 Transcript_58888/m.137596 type:complete len:242 (-) Transcript_58888:17-742(-)
MAHLYQELTPVTVYYDKKSGLSKEKWHEAIKTTRTVYVGNLTFYTTEEQIMDLFTRCGEVRKVVMGLNRFKKQPCGFCFIEYFTHEQAAQAVGLLNKAMLDDRVIRVDWDVGVSEGRQFGRGESGNQWRDDFRTDFDQGRGGEGRNLLRKIEGQPEKQVYVGKRKHDHGRFGAAKNKAPVEELKKPKIEEDPNAIPMQFGKATFGGYRGSAREGQAWGPFAGSGGKGKGKGKGGKHSRHDD